LWLFEIACAAFSALAGVWHWPWPWFIGAALAAFLPRFLARAATILATPMSARWIKARLFALAYGATATLLIMVALYRAAYALSSGFS
jgi:hypothetical protein